MTIIIVGAGQAAGQAAASLRQEGYEDRIVMIGDEAVPPYQRPPLSKQYLSGEHDADKIMVRPAKFYEDRNIELRLGQSVTAINRKAKLVEIADESDSYEKLLISTGSRPRKLNIEGSELGGIFYLRTKADVDDIRTAFSNASSLCIVGGGYIGLEVAAVAKSAGLDVHVLEMESRILQRVTTESMSAFYLSLIHI